MSFDLQIMQDAAPSSIAMPRQHAIYRDVLRANGRMQRARNVADLLERGHRSRPARNTALLVDITA
jgi:hypothetical protein